MNSYVDMVLDAVLAHIQREREAMLGGEPTRRAETIRLILDGAPMATTTASSRLGFEIDRFHTALVLWSTERGLEAGELEQAAVRLARAAGGGRPLVMSAGGSVLWAWIGSEGEGPGPKTEAIEGAAAELDERIRVAIGPRRRGLSGFIRSHRGALAAQRIVAGAGEKAARVVSWEEVQAVALAGQDADAAREFVSSVLGDLAGESHGRSELRETVRVYLAEGSSAPRAARRLHLHRNTVLYRLGKAEERLGYAVGERRLALMLALELARFGG
jgi:DNA-binding PucR family transcriptional regulator